MRDPVDSPRAPRPLGILMLENVPMPFVGCMGNPATFRYPVLFRTVPGAWAPVVMAGDPALTDAVGRTARQLESKGVAALTSNCGFFIHYQRAIAEAVSVPVATSSLVLLPTLAHLAPAGRIGIITADSKLLRPQLLQALGLAGTAPIAIAGIEGSHSWHQMQQPAPQVDPDQLRQDTLDCVERVLRRYPDLRSLLFECTGLGPCSAHVRQQTGLPVYDGVTTADLLMAATGNHTPEPSTHWYAA